MINIAICDDISYVCEQINTYIQEFYIETEEQFEIYIANDAETLYEIMKKEKIDLLFLDIELPDINGVEIGNYIRKKMQDDDMQIVYISGKQDYCRSLFDIRPMNFLDKPFTREDIHKQLKDYLKLCKKFFPTFSYKIGQDTFFQKIDEITYFEIVGKKIKMVTKAFEILFYADMNQIEKELDKFYFVQIHKSYLINMEKIEKYGSKEVIMNGGRRIAISRSKKDIFLNKVLEFEKNKLFTKF
ncbi:LytR/AlgR family response regulator transcription factor [Peptoanaerobacter stomatis]